MRKRQTLKYSCDREILAKIRAKCGKCWDLLKNSTVPTIGKRQATCVRARADTRYWCLTTYAGEPLLFPRESAYVAATKKRSGRDCGERAVRESVFFSDFLQLFLAPLFFLLAPSFIRSLARSFRSLVWFCLPPTSKPNSPLLSRPLFPTRKRSLRCFVSEGETVVTNFAPQPSLDFNSRSRKHNSRYQREFSANPLHKNLLQDFLLTRLIFFYI